MKRFGTSVAVLACLAYLTPTTADAETRDARLSGFQEVPAASTTGQGHFRARIAPDESSIEYELSYEALEGNVLQAHIHFGTPHVNGGISAFLCSNVGSPVPVQACPPPPATITGTITSAEVIGPAGQGISAGELGELIRALRAGATYANVHSSTWPGGEIRGLIRGRGHQH